MHVVCVRWLCVGVRQCEREGCVCGGGGYLSLTQEAAEFHSRSELKRGEGLSHVKKTPKLPIVQSVTIHTFNVCRRYCHGYLQSDMQLLYLYLALDASHDNARLQIPLSLLVMLVNAEIEANRSTS